VLLDWSSASSGGDGDGDGDEGGGDAGDGDGDGGRSHLPQRRIGYRLEDLMQITTLLLLSLVCLKPLLFWSSSDILRIFDYKSNIIYSTNTPS
jgi:hypothetical protein